MTNYRRKFAEKIKRGQTNSTSKNKHGLAILIDIADQTDIRLMLPARTMLVENQAFEELTIDSSYMNK